MNDMYILGKRTLFVTICLLVVYTPFYAGSPVVQATAQSARYGGTLRIAYDADPGSFNGFESSYSKSQYIDRQIYNKLCTYDNSYNLIGDLAKDYPEITSTSEYPSIYTFHLEENIRWFDGIPLTTKDVKFTFETVAWGAQNRTDAPDPSINDRLVEPAYRSSMLSALKKIEILDDYTISFYFNAIQVDSWLSEISASFNIIPHHLWKDFNRHNPSGQTFEDNQYNDNPVGSGAYKVMEYISKQHILMKRNADYFRGVPYLDEMHWLILDPSSMALALENGEIDSIHEVSAILVQMEIPRLKALPQITVDQFPHASTWLIPFNLHPEALELWPWLNDMNVRKAMEYAIDKETIVKQVLDGCTQPAYTAISGIMTPYGGDLNTAEYGYTGPWQIEKRTYDPTKARQLLEEAGWTLNAEGVREKNGVPLNGIQMPYYQRPHVFGPAEALIQAWAAIGIKVTPVPIKYRPFQDYYETSELGLMTRTTEFGGPYPFCYNALSVKHPDSLRDWAQTRSGWGEMGENAWANGYWNMGFYSNVRVDELLELGVSTTEYAERKTYYDELQYRMYEDVGFIILWNSWHIPVYNNNFAGFGSNRPVAYWGMYFRGNDSSTNIERGVYYLNGTLEPELPPQTRITSSTVWSTVTAIMTQTLPEFRAYRILVILASGLLAAIIVSRRRRRAN